MRVVVTTAHGSGRNRTGFAAGLALAALALQGCAMGPTYVRPHLDLPDYVVPGPIASKIADVDWWRTLDNKELVALIVKAVELNHTITAAAERLKAARAGVTVSQSRLFPGVNYSEGVTRARSFGRDPALSTLTSTPASASWIVDFWGKAQRQIEGAQAHALGAEEARRGMVLSVTREVALSYIKYRQNEELLRITQKTIDQVSRYVDDQERKRLSSEARTSQWRYTIQGYVARMPDYRAAQQEALLAMRQLTADLTLTLPPRPHRPLNVRMPERVRADALLRRPDVAQAEQNLRAANAAIGEAEADMLPELSISASGGAAYNIARLGPLINGWSPVWALAANVTGPIFDAGASRAKVEIADARTRDAAAKYREAVLDAFTDTQYALVAHKAAQEKVRELEKGLVLLDKAAVLTEAALGDSADATALIAIANSIYSARAGLASARADAMRATIEVYTAIGGGWVDYLSDKARAARDERDRRERATTGVAHAPSQPGD